MFTIYILQINCGNFSSNYKTFFSIICSDHINQHLDGVQGDLESIKEYLRNEDYSLDANTLLGVSTN